MIEARQRLYLLGVVHAENEQTEVFALTQSHNYRTAAPYFLS